MTLPRVMSLAALAAAGCLVGLAAAPLQASAEPLRTKQVAATGAPEFQQVAERRKKTSPKLREAAPASNEDFTYTLKNIVRARSSEFCERYGVDGSCIEEIEICLTMRDRDDDVVRVCMNTAPDEGGDAKPRVSGLRQKQR